MIGGPGAPRDARRVALDVLRRIEDDGAYANLAVPSALARSGLDRRDRAFVTDLVYGVTRMRRACDFLVDRFLLRPVEPPVRTALRLGAYQLHHLGLPPHAAVHATVACAPPRARGLVNAVLRRVADAGAAPSWPDDGTRLSYPDWVIERLVADLGGQDASAALAAMNDAPVVSERPDGYVQDPASRWVAASVGAGPGARVADLCAAPGGKATALASAGAVVTAVDLRPARSGLVLDNAARLGLGGRLHVVTADARRAPLRPGAFDRVLVDAPCSGLGALRRRPDARWRATPGAVVRLASLQRELLDAAVALMAPGATLVYSVCTLTAAETTAVDGHVASRHPRLVPLDPPGAPWRPWGRGALVLPQDAGTDGMALFRYRSAEGGSTAGGPQ